jgi:hypothetical protein
MKLLYVITIFILMWMPAVAFGWGEEGHRIVASIAESFLTDGTRIEIHTLLDKETLVGVSTWADDIRNETRYLYLKPMHYINVPRRASEVMMERDCPRKRCVAAAIGEYRRALADGSISIGKRREALKLLVHFVGDIHQPLHVSYADDRGGNQIRVSTFEGQGNLHAVWDSGLIKRQTQGDWESWFQAIRTRISPEKATEWGKSLDPLDWARESLQITRDIYTDLPRPGDEPIQLPPDYFDRHIGTVERRLAMAGVRLAAVLNDVLKTK